MREAGFVVLLGVAWTACAGGSSSDVMATNEIAAEVEVVADLDAKPEAEATTALDAVPESEAAFEATEDIDTQDVCVPDCDGKVCGPDGCGSSCGTCPAGQVCEAGQCPCCTCVCDDPVTGEPLECGPDGCGGSCGECADGLLCNAGHCVEPCQPIASPFVCDTPPTALGCACSNSFECGGGSCFDGFCSTVCSTEADCPYGMTCFHWADCDPNPCPDQCFRAFDTLFWPCGSGSGCSANADCIGQGAEGWFCGASCGGDKGCPAGATCAPVVVDWAGNTRHQCVSQGVPCACTPEAIAAGAATGCYRETASGICFGTRACTPTGLSPCSASLPDGDHCQTPGGCGATCAALIEVPRGPFVMGSDDPDAHPNQHPAHVVDLSAFRIRTYLVTAAEYKDCVLAGACSPAQKPFAGPPVDQAYTYGVAGKEHHPINGVTHAQAAAFCAWQGLRLPTEAEWERAARGTDERLYPWPGSTISCNQANYHAMGKLRQTCVGATTAVGSYPEGASAIGAFDMVGNVREWVADHYSLATYPACATGCTDPTGPTDGDIWVTRGGSWNDPAHMQTTTQRSYWPTNGQSSTIGFRCAESAP